MSFNAVLHGFVSVKFATPRVTWERPTGDFRSRQFPNLNPLARTNGPYESTEGLGTLPDAAAAAPNYQELAIIGQKW